MEQHIFLEFVHNLCTYFERKHPSTDSLALWYEDLHNIPAEPLPWITSRIKSLDTFPRNLPGNVRRLFSEWFESNPNKRERDREYGCMGCNHGYIHVSQWEKDLGRYYNIMFRCSHCRPPSPSVMAMATIEWLATQGYYQPVGYLSSWKYADCLKIPDLSREINLVDRKPVDHIVQDIADQYDYPF